ncbi:MIS12 protein, partial [Amia calva]|nr:MIS12 protein [Amia calva]
MLRVYTAFQDCLYEVLLAVETVLVKKLGGLDAGDEVTRQARECTRQLLALLQERINRLSGRMEVLLQSSVLEVPPNVLLPEDAPHQKYPHRREQLLELEGELAGLQRRYQAEMCAKQSLLAELQEQREVQAELDSVLTWIGELRAAWAQGGMGSFHESFGLMTQVTKRLQDTLKEIEARVGGLEK